MTMTDQDLHDNVVVFTPTGDALTPDVMTGFHEATPEPERDPVAHFVFQGGQTFISDDYDQIGDVWAVTGYWSWDRKYVQVSAPEIKDLIIVQSSLRYIEFVRTAA